MITIAVITSIGELHIIDVYLPNYTTNDIDGIVVDKFGNNQNWQVITKTVKHSKEDKTFIFLTLDGTTCDGSGEDVENCQMLTKATGIDALTAYNNMLSARSWTGYFDTCYCYELASDNPSYFDLCNDEDEQTDNKCPDCGEYLCQESDNVLFCTECGYVASDNKDDTVYHCNNCDRAIGKSDFEVGDGLCVDCIG